MTSIGAAQGRFSRICQIAPICSQRCVLPSAHPSPQPKRHLDQFGRFCTAHCRVSSEHALPLPNCPFPGISGHALNARFLGSTRLSNPNGMSIHSVVFAQLTADSPYTLQLAAPSPQITGSHGRSRLPSKTWFPEPTRAHNPSRMSIGSAVFCTAH